RLPSHKQAECLRALPEIGQARRGDPAVDHERMIANRETKGRLRFVYFNFKQLFGGDHEAGVTFPQLVESALNLFEARPPLLAVRDRALQEVLWVSLAGGDVELRE